MRGGFQPRDPIRDRGEFPWHWLIWIAVAILIGFLAAKLIW